MSGYIFQEFVKDFSGRTRQNMRVIDAIYDEHSDDPEKKVYEVTQVINSLFGMIIVPYEKFKDQINKSEYADINSYKEIKKLIHELDRNKFLRSTYPGDSEEVGVFSFIGHLRNALAHSGNGRLNFYPVNSKKDNIKAVYFMDRYENQNGRISYFCCRLSVKRIRKLCELIPSLYEVIEKSIPERERAIIFDQYISQISLLDGFLNGADAVEMNGVFD